MDLKNFTKAINQIAEEKSIEPNKVIETIETAIAAAYRKEYGKKSEIVRAKLDPKTGEVKFWQVKTVVDQNIVWPPETKISEIESEEKKPRYNPDRHIWIEEAKKIKSDAQIDEELEFPLETHDDFGRIAAQAAKQVIIQKLREAEREAVYKEFENKEGEIVSGIVQRFERGNIYVDLGRTTGVMFANESIPGEHYRVGARMRFYVLAIQKEGKIPGIILSRAHPKFISKLFELEVPEIAEGVVEIKAIAREPGSRSKIAVFSKAEGVDPIGSLVGQRGTRVMAVTNELFQEKIDIVDWSEDPEKFIASSLSPAKVKGVEIKPRREAIIIVPDDQLSLAIGKSGQNVRLAAKMTGWKLDVRSDRTPEKTVGEGVVKTTTQQTEEIRPEGIETAQIEKTETKESEKTETEEITNKPKKTRRKKKEE